MRTKRKHLFWGSTLTLLTLSSMVAAPISVLAENRMSVGTTALIDDFNGTSLDTNKWLVADKMWGGFNGGVVPENVSVKDGTLRLEGHGNRYKGSVEGNNKKLPGGIRTGAAIASREYYASGSYEVVAKVAPELGACSAIWTFQYEEYEKGTPGYEKTGSTGAYGTVNHEIDIELPTANENHKTPSFEAARFNTYTAENRHNSQFKDLPYAVNDGKFHTYRFDWHTGDKSEQKRVDFYVDGQLITTSTQEVPTNASRFWIGIWFPASVDSDKDGFGDTGWTGTADFDTTVFEIDSVKITPFLEEGDTISEESFPDDGWATDSFPEQTKSEAFDHIKNGSFANGFDGWEKEGDIALNDEKVTMQPDHQTKTLSQTVSVLPKMSYHISADVYTDGAKATIGVRKKNGNIIAEKTIADSQKVDLTFETERAMSEVEVFIQTKRYQTGRPVIVDNVVLKGGKGSDSTLPLVYPTVIEKTDEPVVTTEETSSTETSSTETSTTEVTSEPSTSVEQLLPLTDGLWKLSGHAAIQDNFVTLASGSDTDEMSRKVSVQKDHTYTLKAEVVTDGAEVRLGVHDYNGRYTKVEKEVTTSGTYYLTFRTAKHIDNVDIKALVERYQENESPAIIKSISLLDGDVSVADTIAEKPEVIETEETPKVTLSSITLGEWILHGSAVKEVNGYTLSGGSDTDSIDQKVSVQPNTTYRLSADIKTSQIPVDLIVRNHNGRYSEESVHVTKNQTGELIFTTGHDTKEVTISIQTLRYQDGSASVSNIVLNRAN